MRCLDCLGDGKPTGFRAPTCHELFPAGFLEQEAGMTEQERKRCEMMVNGGPGRCEELAAAIVHGAQRDWPICQAHIDSPHWRETWGDLLRPIQSQPVAPVPATINGKPTPYKVVLTAGVGAGKVWDDEKQDWILPRPEPRRCRYATPVVLETKNVEDCVFDQDRYDDPYHAYEVHPGSKAEMASFFRDARLRYVTQTREWPRCEDGGTVRFEVRIAPPGPDLTGLQAVLVCDRCWKAEA